MKKLIEFEPAYDKRNSDPAKDYGIGSMRIRFVLMGELGATQFLIGTGMYLKHNRQEMNWKNSGYNPFEPNGWDVGYHSPIPRYESHTMQVECCPYLDGKPCYYDGSGLRAERLMEEFLEHGEKVVWRELTEYYIDLFGELK